MDLPVRENVPPSRSSIHLNEYTYQACAKPQRVLDEEKSTITLFASAFINFAPSQSCAEPCSLDLAAIGSFTDDKRRSKFVKRAPKTSKAGCH